MKIVVTGPESSGKTTLVEQLSKHYSYPTLEEYARTYLEQHGIAYQYNDIVIMAKNHYRQINKLWTKKDLILDTGIINYKIWTVYKYGKYETIWDQWIRELKADLYFLLYPDIKWEFDPLRENPNHRNELFCMFENELINKGCNYYIITGSGHNRFQNAINHLHS